MNIVGKKGEEVVASWLINNGYTIIERNWRVLTGEIDIIAIEKGFQSGGKELRETGYDVYSLAIVDEMNDEGMIYFKEQ